MPRIPRGQRAGHAYHVLNRGNGGAAVFHKDGDSLAFLDLLATAKTTYAVKVFGFCVMPNHFPLVLQPATQAALSPFMQWGRTSHVRRYHRHDRSHGHVWQGRFKSVPIQQDGHLLTVLRYVLRNPVRAGLVARTSEWPWSSLRFSHLIDPWPIERPPTWDEWVEQPLVEHDLTGLRTCVNRQQPFGAPDCNSTSPPRSGSNPRYVSAAAHGIPQKRSLSPFLHSFRVGHAQQIAIGVVGEPRQPVARIRDLGHPIEEIVTKLGLSGR